MTPGRHTRDPYRKVRLVFRGYPGAPNSSRQNCSHPERRLSEINGSRLRPERWAEFRRQQLDPNHDKGMEPRSALIQQCLTVSPSTCSVSRRQIVARNSYRSIQSKYPGAIAGR
jgi:hypothetical protein